jgi:hypothetical protein
VTVFILLAAATVTGLITSDFLRRRVFGGSSNSLKIASQQGIDDSKRRQSFGVTKLSETGECISCAGIELIKMP